MVEVELGLYWTITAQSFEWDNAMEAYNAMQQYGTLNKK